MSHQRFALTVCLLLATAFPGCHLCWYGGVRSH
jgi:hypothetical protein